MEQDVVPAEVEWILKLNIKYFQLIWCIVRSQTKIKEERSEELDNPAFNDVIFGGVHSSICWQILEHSLGKKQEGSC